MVVPPARRIVALTALVMALSLAATAKADPIYNVTNLGSYYSFQQDADGTILSVTSGDGSRTYSFEKSPVTVSTVYPSGRWNDPIYWPTVTIASKEGGSISYEIEKVPGVSFPIYQSLGLPYIMSGPVAPLQDINKFGVIVGSEDGASAIKATMGDLKAEKMPWLDHQISESLNVRLKIAFKIDDLGDIVASGTLGGKDAYFLLTPNGSPTPAPEPSTLAFLSLGLAALGVRAARRRRGRLG